MSQVSNIAAILKNKAKLKAGDNFYWSPAENTVYYRSDSINNKNGILALIHEAGHVIRGHRGYTRDTQLLIMESEAWEAAESIAKKLDIRLPANHIQKCLDTYREWLFKRSRCPACQSSGLQTKNLSYECLNCGQAWRVTESLFCRPYRRSN